MNMMNGNTIIQHVQESDSDIEFCPTKYTKHMCIGTAYTRSHVSIGLK